MLKWGLFASGPVLINRLVAADTLDVDENTRKKPYDCFPKSTIDGTNSQLLRKEERMYWGSSVFLPKSKKGLSKSEKMHLHIFCKLTKSSLN